MSQTANPTASARKSLGSYKPVVVFPNGRTEVVEQSPERFARNTRAGEIPGNKFARGTTYTTRDEAIAAAQKMIDARLADAVARRAEYAAKGVSAERLGPFDRQIEFWGGKL